MKERKACVGISKALRTDLLRWEWTHWVVGGNRYPIIIQADSWDLITAQRLKFINQNPPLGLQTSASHHGQNYLLSAVLQSITLTELIHPKKNKGGGQAHINAKCGYSKIWILLMFQNDLIRLNLIQFLLLPLSRHKKKSWYTLYTLNCRMLSLKVQ